jgi:O-antigen/teichoic acid export membrane protein
MSEIGPQGSQERPAKRPRAAPLARAAALLLLPAARLWSRRWQDVPVRLAGLSYGLAGAPLVRAAAGILGAQAAIQGTNLLIGLLILRHLTVGHYAIYAISGTLVGIGTVLASMSLHPALSYHVARAGEDRDRLATLVRSASRLQGGLLVLAMLAITAVALSYRHQFVSDWQFVAALAIIQLNILLAARLELARSVFYALQTARPIILADSGIALARAAVIVPILLLAPAAGVLPVLLANATAQVVAFATLRLPFRRERGGFDRGVARRLLRYMAPLWPENIYYLLQGNIAALVLAWVGTRSQIAELGALTRLVQIVMILAILNRFLVQPYVSRYQSGDDFRRRVVRVLGVYFGGAAALLLVAWLVPEPFLWVLGPHYQHLTAYVAPVMTLAVVSLGGTVAYALCLSSGRPGGLSLTIPFNFALQVVYIALVGLTTVGAALGFMLVTAAGELLTRLAVLVWLCRRRKAAVAP